MAEIKNLTTLAQGVATAANTARDAAISAANEAVITEVRTTVITEVVKEQLGENINISDLATKADVNAAATTAADNLADAVDILEGKITTNKTAAENALSSYQTDMEDTIQGINTAIGEKGNDITAAVGRIQVNESDIAQAKADIQTNATAIAGKVSTTDFDTYKSTVYTKAEINELLGNEAGVSEIIGTYTKDKIDELLAREMDVENTYSKTQTDNLLAGKADTDTVTTLSSNVDQVKTDIVGLKNTDNALSDRITTNANDILTINGKAETAVTQSSNAVATANTAKSKAETAETNAATALSTANSATQTAATAVTTANSATETAATAVSTANTAKETADTAKETADGTASDLSTYKGEVATALGAKASVTYVDDAISSLNSTVTTALATKAVASEVTEALATKVDVSTYNTFVADVYRKADVYTKTEINTIHDTYALKTQVDAVNTALDNYKTQMTTTLNSYVRTEVLTQTADGLQDNIDAKLDTATYNSDKLTLNTTIGTLAVQSDVTAALATKVDATTYNTAIANVYTKSEVYTKEEVDAAINAAVAQALEDMAAAMAGE